MLTRVTGSIGTIGVIDHDVVEISNLHRQVLHTEERVGMAKVLSAAEAVKKYILSCVSLAHSGALTTRFQPEFTRSSESDHCCTHALECA